MGTEAMVRKVADLTPAVAGEHASYKQALAAEEQARGQVLAQVRRLVKPALPAICSQVIVGGVIAIGGAQTREAAAWRGLKLGGNGLQPRIVVNRRGSFSGHELYLHEDGDFVEIRFDGRWSGVPGEETRWGSTPYRVPDVDVARDHQTEVIIARIIRALEAQLQGGKAEKIRDLHAMAARLDAVAAMLKAPL